MYVHIALNCHVRCTGRKCFVPFFITLLHVTPPSSVEAQDCRRVIVTFERKGSGKDNKMFYDYVPVGDFHAMQN